VKVLSRVFRGKFLAALEQAFRKQQLTLAGRLTDFQSPNSFAALLRSAARQDWVVYAKRPFAGSAQVLSYLARYTHRVAIANSRLVSMSEGKVSFRWRDYAHGNRTRIMTLQADEFLRRFLLHVLPTGFVRIRHFGLFANRQRTQLIDLCRTRLQAAPRAVDTPQKQQRCPFCDQGFMVVVEMFTPARLSLRLAESPPSEDSS
jgi:hypothetical protein